MKKVLIGFLVLVFVASAFFAGTRVSLNPQAESTTYLYKDKSDIVEKQDIFTVEGFSNKYNGYWGYRDNNSWQLLQINDERFTFSTFQGHMWNNGDIINIEQNNNRITLTIKDEPLAWDDEQQTAAIETKFVLSSDDNFSDNIAIELYNRSVSLSFLGSTIVDVENNINAINTILNRPLIYADVSDIYTRIGYDWNEWSMYTNYTVFDILNESFDLDKILWKIENTEDSGFKTVYFAGTGNSAVGNVVVLISFVVFEKTQVPPMVGFMMKKDKEVLEEYTISSIAQNQNLDIEEATYWCDIVSGILLLSSFVNI